MLTVSVWACQVLAGCTFIVSGLSKTNDPLGMTILLQNYLNAAGIYLPHWSQPVTIAAIMMAVFEVTMGAYLLFGSHKKVVSRLGLAFMVVMTLITGYNAMTDTVPECGCFGSAIEMTNMQSFAKNIVLIAMMILICVKQNIMYSAFTRSARRYITTLFMFGTLGISFWTWNTLPLIDFTPYRTGTDIIAATMGEYDVVDGKSVEIAAPTIKDFALTDAEGEDMTDEILFYPDTVMLITVPSENQADSGNGGKMTLLWDEMEDKGQKIYLVVAGTIEDAERFKDRTGLGCPTLFGSIEMLQTIVRANPGMVKMYGGKIIEKKNISK